MFVIAFGIVRHLTPLSGNHELAHTGEANGLYRWQPVHESKVHGSETGLCRGIKNIIWAIYTHS